MFNFNGCKTLRCVGVFLLCNVSQCSFNKFSSFFFFFLNMLLSENKATISYNVKLKKVQHWNIHLFLRSTKITCTFVYRTYTCWTRLILLSRQQIKHSFCAGQTGYNYNIQESLRAESSLKRSFEWLTRLASCSGDRLKLVSAKWNTAAEIVSEFCSGSIRIFRAFSRRSGNKLCDNQKPTGDFMTSPFVFGSSLHIFINLAQKT